MVAMMKKRFGLERKGKLAATSEIFLSVCPNNFQVPGIRNQEPLQPEMVMLLFMYVGCLGFITT